MSERAPSIRSVASSASGVSLSRRPRTTGRSRSRTITGASGRPVEPPLDSLPISSDLPYLAGTITQEPLGDPFTVSTLSPSEGPSRPTRSPHRQGHLENGFSSQNSDTTTASSQLGTAVDATVVVEPPPSTPSPTRPVGVQVYSSEVRILVAHLMSCDILYFVKVKPTKASTLPLLNTGYRPPPSAFSRDPALTPTTNVRDSVSTQRSGASSSLYPPSTPTASRPESPSTPHSIFHPIETLQPVQPSPEVQEAREYDNDDVAYRLRLLVNNSYFLPPAHSKPSPADLAPVSLDASKRSAKSPTPTFLDLFRVGKSKSKPSTPTSTTGVDFPVPMLRTTSDSITTPYVNRNQQTQRPSPQISRLPSPINPPTAPRGRVVVVREKVEDIMVAAKQAEQDLKAKGAARADNQGSQISKQNGSSGIIDPTDAVDIPLPSPSYPFAVQASALHGLGVQDSVGAAVLADRLPPNMSHSYDPVEDTWRKALLHQAVHHSLDNTPDTSSFSHILASSTPPRAKSNETPRTKSPATLPPTSPVPLLADLQKKIIEQPIIDIIESTPTKQKRPSTSHSQSVQKSLAKTLIPTLSLQPSRPGSYLPQRADTPSGPMTPLGPAPRRTFMNSPSMSQTNLTMSSPLGDQSMSSQSQSFSDSESYRRIRRIHSSPQLAEGYETTVSRQDELIPPLPNYSRNSQALSINTLRASYQTIAGSSQKSIIDNGEGEQDDLPPRPSMAASRPSMSEYSQASASASPTTSAFQDMLNRPDSAFSDPPGSSKFSFDRGTTSSIRYTAMSPPPRISSSLAHVALPPPPRSSSAYAMKRQFAPLSLSSDSSRTEPAGLDEEEETTLQIIAPEPTTPPLPEESASRREERRSLERRRKISAARVPPALSISNDKVPVKIHSAPGPSSPTNFFDDIQSHPNAMDDLESSSDEDEGGTVVSVPPKVLSDSRGRSSSIASPNASSFSHSSGRAPIMKHGNYSTPYVRSGGTMSNMVPIGHSVGSKKPVLNVPIKLGKSELPSSSFDFFKYAEEHPPPGSIFAFGIGDSSGSGSGSPIEPPRPATADRVNMGPSSSKVGGVVLSQTAQDSFKKLDGMLLRHMEDEKDTIKRIATTMKQSKQATS